MKSVHIYDSTKLVVAILAYEQMINKYTFFIPKIVC